MFPTVPRRRRKRENIRPAFSASANGVLVYRQTPDAGANQLAWYSREGKRLENVGGKSSYINQVRLSPDERYAAVVTGFPSKIDPRNHIYLLDFRTDVMSRLTFGERQDQDPVWLPDSRRIVYGDHGIPRTAEYLPSRLMELTIGERAPRLLREEKSDFISPDDWSPDGRFLLCRRNNRALFRLPLEGAEQPAVLFDIDARFTLDEAHFSPDGRWVAYNSNESGEWQVYVSSFPSMTGKKQVSTENGCIPFWRKDGRELFYMTRRGQVMSVAVKAGPAFDPSAPKRLFQVPGDVYCGLDRYAVAGNGQKFLMIEADPQPQVVEPMHVILHWDAELRR